MQYGDQMSMKVVGRKGVTKGLLAANNLFKTVVALRGKRPFIPKGIHRFKSFEEAQRWSLRMITRRPTPGRQP